MRVTCTQSDLIAVYDIKVCDAVTVIACKDKRYKYGAGNYQQSDTAVYHDVCYHTVTFSFADIFRRGPFYSIFYSLFGDNRFFCFSECIGMDNILFFSVFKKCFYIIYTAGFKFFIRVHFLSFQAVHASICRVCIRYAKIRCRFAVINVIIS